MVEQVHGKMVRAQTQSALPVRALEDEAAVIAAAQKGQNGSFEVLVERYERRILLLALRITRNWQDAEDVKQQSFQKAYFQLHQFQGKSSFSTWLTRIAINEALILRRKTYRWREVSFEKNENSSAPEYVEICDLENGLEMIYQEQERKQILSMALKMLSPRVRRAIQLRELEERSSRETAQILGISVQAVKSRVFHGRRQLQKALTSPPPRRPVLCNPESQAPRNGNSDCEQDLRGEFLRRVGL
jgi:RNA polymerase sigma-70 factor (ECF subfamily)